MKGEYQTKSRRAIVDYLREHADRRFTAGDIIRALDGAGNKVNRSTIYRNLERLTEEGRLVRYKESNVAAVCYQYSEQHTLCHMHIHAQCQICGKIYHLENKIFMEAEDRMKDGYGMEIDYGRTVIIGRCQTCK